MNLVQAKQEQEKLQQKADRLDIRIAMLEKLENDEKIQTDIARLKGAVFVAKRTEKEFQHAVAAMYPQTDAMDPISFEKYLEVYRKKFERDSAQVDRVAKETVRQIIVDYAGTMSGGWGVVDWLRAVAFSKAFEAHRGRIYRALVQVSTDRGDDSHGDLVDALALFLDAGHVGMLEDTPSDWKSIVDKQTLAYSAISHKFGRAPFVEEHVLGGENYFMMKLDEAILTYAKSVDWS